MADQRLEIQKLKGEVSLQLEHIGHLVHLANAQESALKQIMLRASSQHDELRLILMKATRKAKETFGEICQICAPFLQEIDDQNMPADFKAQIETYQARMKGILAARGEGESDGVQGEAGG